MYPLLSSMVTSICKYQKYAATIKGKNPVQQKKLHLLLLYLYFYILLFYN